jgi:hypothetical protein
MRWTAISAQIDELRNRADGWIPQLPARWKQLDCGF